MIGHIMYQYQQIYKRQMKSLANNECNTEQTTKHKSKLIQLAHHNTQAQSYINHLQEQISTLSTKNTHLSLLISERRQELTELEKDEEEKQQYQQEEEMATWIQEVQKYTGVPPQVIDSLLTMDYEGGEDNQICLSCYQPMAVGNKCKYLPCYHIYHAECIDNHLKLNKVCPACGEEVIG